MGFEPFTSCKTANFHHPAPESPEHEHVVKSLRPPQLRTDPRRVREVRHLAGTLLRPRFRGRRRRPRESPADGERPEQASFSYLVFFLPHLVAVGQPHLLRRPV